MYKIWTQSKALIEQNISSGPQSERPYNPSGQGRTSRILFRGFEHLLGYFCFENKK